MGFMHHQPIKYKHINPESPSHRFFGIRKSSWWWNSGPKAKPLLLRQIVQPWSSYNMPSKTAGEASWQQEWVLLYDNVGTSILPLAHVLLADFACCFLFHSPYSLDLAPSDFHVFTHLKQFLGGMCMDNE
jgi:hypothetical protein